MKRTRHVDLTGQTFGRLTALRRVPPPPNVKFGNRNAYWECRCECGSVKVIAARVIKSGHTASCGCFHSERSAETARELFSVHGYSRPGNVAPEYSVWRSMIARCENENDRGYANYGGRGIKVCKRWRTSFTAFKQDMGKRPKGMSIDRIDNDGNYEPDNCRWASKTAQARNRRDRAPVEFNGRSMFLVDWAKETGIKLATLHDRIYKHGWTIEKALTTDPRLYHDSRSSKK